MNSLRFARFAFLRMAMNPAFIRSFAGFAEFTRRISEIMNEQLEGC